MKKEQKLKKLYIEIFVVLALVIFSTAIIYRLLSPVVSFWSTQNVWNIILLGCWSIVSIGYWHQGLMIHKAKTASHVSLFLPTAVFCVQCILFVKGIYYKDYALVVGAVMVNSAVLFDIKQIYHFKNK